MKTRISVIALIFVSAGVFGFSRTKNTPPSDLRDAVASQDFDITIPAFESNDGNIPVPKAAVIDTAKPSYVINENAPVKFVSFFLNNGSPAYVPNNNAPIVPISYFLVNGIPAYVVNENAQVKPVSFFLNNGSPAYIPNDNAPVVPISYFLVNGVPAYAVNPNAPVIPISYFLGTWKAPAKKVKVSK